MSYIDHSLGRSETLLYCARFPWFYPGCAWALLLGHYAEANDVVFGAAFSGRPEQIDGIDTMIGPCVTNVPVRAKFVPGEPLPAFGVRCDQRHHPQHHGLRRRRLPRWWPPAAASSPRNRRPTAKTAATA